jgi:hypothetical protein
MGEVGEVSTKEQWTGGLVESTNGIEQLHVMQNIARRKGVRREHMHALAMSRYRRK